MHSAQKYTSGSTLYGPLRIGLAALVVFSLSTNASGQSEPDGVCSTVDVPGATSVTAEGINNAGVVVGSYAAADSSWHGYIYANGQITTLTAPDSLWTYALDINDAGVVVGVYGPATPICNCVADIEVHAFRYANGAFTTFDVGLSQTWPRGINNAGTIVGYYHDRDGDITDHPRGFLLSAGGGLTRIDGPGGGPLSEVGTYVRGINDAGVAVGYYYAAAEGNSLPLYGFTWRNGVMTELRHPEAPLSTVLHGINDAETIVGVFNPGQNQDDAASFTFANSRFSRFDCSESTEPPPQSSGPPKVQMTALNNRGAMVGSRWADGLSRALVTKPITFIDPIPDLSPPGQVRITASDEVLATRGRSVQAIAADGVSQIVVRIPVSSVGESVTVTVYKTKTVAAGNGETGNYGAVGTPREPCPGDGCDEDHVTVFGVFTSQGPMAFALYRAPLDFVRYPALVPDTNVAYRDVYLRVQTSSGSTTIPLKVLRPPVALVHGIWSSAEMWNNFDPYALRDPRFHFIPVDYGTPIRGRLISTEPYYFTWGMTPRQSALGVRFNAKYVFPQIYRDIDAFKNGNNPLGLSVAAIQADFVVHSMGGLITRYLPRVPGYRRYTMGHGVVHKLITIDTPHTGSPLATRFMLQLGNPLAGCLRGILRVPGNLVVRQARLRMEPEIVNGAAFDLELGSDIVGQIAATGVGAIPTALITGVYTSWGSLNLGPGPVFIRQVCQYDDIAQALTSTGWPNLMLGPDNDAMVTLASQKAGIANAPHSAFQGAHSDALGVLGFGGPYVTTDDLVSEEAITLLNTPFTVQSKYICLPQGLPCGQQQQ